MENGLSPGGSPANRSAQQLEVEISEVKTCGRKCCESSVDYSRSGLSLKTYQSELSCMLLKALTECGIGVELQELPPPHWVPRIGGRGGGYLPTPTRCANHSSPSMRKWPAYRLWQDLTGGRTHPISWEWMMGFPLKWTDSADSGMQLSLRSQS